ncbi:MAG: DUF2029 domain-containing protein [Rhodoferax sp.]|nr:DUF2029 domain-containing protein [Actinomycetota bacterium]
MLALLSAALLIGTSALGPSAASPSLGPATALPPYALGVHPSSGVVTVLLVAAYLAGGTAVASGLWAVRHGAVVPRSWIVAAGCVAALAVLVPPLGSADHLSYAAYGRIAVQGGDPYVVPPVSWTGGLDPVTSAVEDPWTRTPSLYGPVATGVQALTSLVGGDSLRRTVWLWQLACLVSWLAVGVLLRRRGGSRGAWLWLLNPVLLGLLLVGAHVDLLAAALGLGALLLVPRRSLLAGVLLGAAVGVKLTFVLFAPAILYALWRNRSGWRPVLLGVAGAALVLVPSYVVAGSHAFDQLGQARRFVSLATPWRLLVDAYGARGLVLLLWPLVAVVLVVLLARALRPRPAGSDVTSDAARAAVVLGAAYVLAAPYSLPWYDAIAWAPLALATTGLDALLLVRLVVLALAYVPGRVAGMSPQVHDLTLGYRREVAPWLGIGLLLWLVVLARRVETPRTGHRASRH